MNQQQPPSINVMDMYPRVPDEHLKIIVAGLVVQMEGNATIRMMEEVFKWIRKGQPPAPSSIDLSNIEEVPLPSEEDDLG